MPLQHLSQIVQGGLGVGQLIGGLLKGKPRQPKFEIPDEVNQSLSIAQQQAYAQQAPGISEAESRARSTTSNTISNVQDATSNVADVLNAAGAAQARENNAMENISARNEQYKIGAQRNLQQNLLNKANYERLKFDINEMQPFQRRYAERASLINSGIQNLAGAADSFVGNRLAMGGNRGRNRRTQQNRSYTLGDVTVGPFNQPLNY